MLFNSFDFLHFVTVIFAIYIISPQKYRWFVLLSASYFFYGSKDMELLIYLIIPTIAVYFISKAMKVSISKKRLYLIAGISIPVLMLFTFKYLNLFWKTFGSLFIQGEIKSINIILPIGISFYTFRLISYIVDIYNNKLIAEKHFGYFALYVSFFPQLLAGPIDRGVNFIPQLKNKFNLSWYNTINGLKLILLGLFKKIVIADRMALFVNQLYVDPSRSEGLNLLFGAYFFAFQIYCDFSGYSDIAIGVSRIFGIKSMENFNFPYFSKTLTEFWNRWHISLSTWLRDYLFLPIAYFVLRKTKKNRIIGIKTENFAYAGGMFITMLLGGLWHGARWTFVIWGSLHGLYLIFSHFTKRKRKKLTKKTGFNKFPRIRSLLKISLTFHLVTFAWIFFRAPSFAIAIEYIENINFSLPESGAVHLMFTLILMTSFIIIELILKNINKFNWIDKIPAEIKIAFYALSLCIIIILSVDGTNEFLYFQF